MAKSNATERLGKVGERCRNEALQEHHVLTLICSVYQQQHLREDARKSFASFLGCSDRHVDHCLAGSAHLGDEAWQIIIMHCGPPADEIRAEWFREVERRHNAREKSS